MFILDWFWNTENATKDWQKVTSTMIHVKTSGFPITVSYH